MVQEKKIQREGEVIESLPNASFRVLLDDNSVVLAHLAGKLRIYRIQVLVGDKVVVEMTPYDKSRGRIVYRKK